MENGRYCLLVSSLANIPLAVFVIVMGMGMQENRYCVFMTYLCEPLCTLYCTIFYTSAMQPVYTSYDIPNGFKTLSLATLAATVPPFCNAMAPMIAYVVWARISSMPDALRLFIYTLSALLSRVQTAILTSFGVHLIISRIPIAVASPAILDFAKTSLSDTSVKFAKPSSAGCLKGSRSSFGFGSDWVFVAVGECSNARFV